MYNIGLTNRVDITKIDNIKGTYLGENHYEIISFDTFNTVGQLLGYMGLKRNEYDIYKIKSEHAPGEIVKAINVGDNNVASYGGVEYELDGEYAYGDGNKYLLEIEVLDTESDRLYYYGRWGYNFGFNIELNPDIYYVTLHFSEPWYDSTGIRLFDVIINKETKIEDLDLVYETRNLYDKCDINLSSGRRRALDIRRVVPVRTGNLNIQLKSKRLDAIISGIKINKVVINAIERIVPSSIDDTVKRKDRVLFWNKELRATKDEILQRYGEVSGLPSDVLFRQSLL